MTPEQLNRMKRSWRDMLRRCDLKVRRTKYTKYYSGISVCDRWASFENFPSDMGDMPAGMTLDRIDNTEDYTPENCRWATPKTQMRNRRNTVRVTPDGVSPCIADIAEEYGVSAKKLRVSLNGGASLSQAVSEAYESRKSEGHASREIRSLIAKSGMSFRTIQEKTGVSLYKLSRWTSRYTDELSVDDADKLTTLLCGEDIDTFLDRINSQDKVKKLLTGEGVEP